MDTVIRTPRNLFATAVVVAASYYIGVQVGLALTFPPATTSVLWPPNAILTAALIIVPPSAWWVCLGAALPVHILLEIGAGFSPALVGLLFLTNCSEALMAAIGVRLLSDAPTRFDSFRRVAAFIGAAGLIAPILSSFADAAVVNLLRGEPYWDVWRTRVFANVLTELSVVPLVVLGWRAIREGLRWPGRARAAEAVALGLVLGAAATVIFKRPYLGDAMPGVPPTPIVLLLPVFGWAAIRFGVGGVSAALFGSAMVASHETAVGFRPFAAFSPASSLIAVQMILAVVAMPLMCIAGLLAERRRDTATLAARLRFEELLSTVASSFVRLPNFGVAVDECVARVCEFFRIDTAVLFHLDEPSNTPGSSGNGTRQVCRRWRPRTVSDGFRPALRASSRAIRFCGRVSMTSRVRRPMIGARSQSSASARWSPYRSCLAARYEARLRWPRWAIDRSRTRTSTSSGWWSMCSRTPVRKDRPRWRRCAAVRSSRTWRADRAWGSWPRRWRIN